MQHFSKSNMTVDAPTFQSILVQFPLSNEDLQRIQNDFKTVYYYPKRNAVVPEEVYADIEVAFVHTVWGFPESLRSLDQMPKLRLIQTNATGVEVTINHPAVQTATPEKLASLVLSNSCGGYCLAMPNFVLNYITGLYNSIPSMIYYQRVKKRWAQPSDIMEDARRVGTYGARPIYGKTFGFLGYGSLGREFARVCTIFPKSRIIAANSTGTRTIDDTFTFEGTGDLEAKLPEKMYSTSDPESFKEFISECDILVSCLPSTAKTTHLLDAEKLSWMKPHGVFINVGRGTLIQSEEIIKALDAPNGLLGAAIDVTDPEPLPTDHFLWDHPRLMITPHLSGETENEFTQSTTILLGNVECLREGKPHLNDVDIARGY